MGRITFEVNNQRVMELEQKEHDGVVRVITGSNLYDEKFEISQGDFIMLMNYYRYQKENDLPIF